MIIRRYCKERQVKTCMMLKMASFELTNVAQSEEICEAPDHRDHQKSKSYSYEHSGVSSIRNVLTYGEHIVYMMADESCCFIYGFF